MLLLTFIVLGLMAWSLFDLAPEGRDRHGYLLSSLSLILVLLLGGFYSLQPNEAAAITLFGNYKGTDRTAGLRWVLPWYQAHQDFAARAQRHRRDAEGERQARQPDRDRRGRGLARDRHRARAVRRR